jgi:hypothetical protein
MPIDPRKRQKQQERRAAKRKSKQHHLVQEKQAGLAARLESAARYPVLHCWVTTDMWTKGLGWVCLSRELPNGTIAYAVFLVDRYCLGVKNAMADVVGRFTYDSRVVRKMRRTFTSEDFAPAAARKLVEQAVEYAGAVGLRPHPDCHKAKLIFGDIDAGNSTEEFEFGKDGRPFFISGPHDTPERCRLILNTLLQKCGVDGFDYLIPVSEPARFLPEALKEKRPRLIDVDDAGVIRDLDYDLAEDEDR